MASNLKHIRKIKLEKIKALRKSGHEPYPEMQSKRLAIFAVQKQFDELVVGQKKYYVAGRVMARREHGGAAFVDLHDGSGKLQLHFKQDLLKPDAYKFFLDFVDIGDFIEAYGSFFITRRGEQTQEVHEFAVLSKALLPLPEKWHGLSDVDERFRKRYLDLLMNEKVREVFVKRSLIVKTLREFLEGEGFMEVETPILQAVPGGAIARPFKTKLNAMRMDLYLRVAPELYLKRLLVGGFEKVYEIGRQFRNEGMDATHNPDFTMMECYAAYENDTDMMARTERMMRHIISQTHPSAHLQVEWEGKTIDFQGAFAVVGFNELLKKHTGIEYDAATVAQMVKRAKELKVEVPKGAGKGKIADELYKTLARPHIIYPTFLVHHPIELSPLAKQKQNDPTKAARFQLIAGGMEIANGYSELNDPEQQRARFKAQVALAKKGDEEAQPADEEFAEALEYGMPPSAGLGVGVERLVVLLTGMHSVREVMLFPTMKPKGKK
ncbi:lysine--tRNA ligase [Candidatus Azambacteria bacterium]|nr:lysine--tRNA ligase [Candidatus Azambacteria bacterium]MBI3684870.1 lysine--tRNA ligase [Candidatus Azambacteria bacterium]